MKGLKGKQGYVSVFFFVKQERIKNRYVGDSGFFIITTQLIAYMFGHLYLNVGMYLQKLAENKTYHLVITSQYSVVLHCNRECICLETHTHVIQLI